VYEGKNLSTLNKWNVGYQLIVSSHADGSVETTMALQQWHSGWVSEVSASLQKLVDGTGIEQQLRPAGVGGVLGGLKARVLRISY
jgi:hypothetical protein